MTLAQIGGYAAAVAAIGAALTLIVKGFKVCCKARDAFYRIERHQTDTYMMTLKLIIMSPEMPMSERIEAGDKYIALGGNGAVKQRYKSLLYDFEQEEFE